MIDLVEQPTSFGISHKGINNKKANEDLLMQWYRVG